MSELLKESMKRRFVNKTNIILLLIITMVLSGLMFSDVIIHQLMPSYLDKIQINLDVDEVEIFLNAFENDIEHSTNATITIEEKNNDFTIYSEEKLTNEEQKFIENMIYTYKSILNNPNGDFNLEFMNVEEVKNNGDYLYILITGIYFMMLAYSTIVANEVVMEKATNVIELICTSVDIKIHYYSKIIIGSLTVFIQLFSIIPIFTFLVFIRNKYDKAKGLLSMLYRYHILENEYDSIASFLTQLDITNKTVIMFGVSLLFLFVGLMIIQVITVLISCRVESVEEAGALQGPFYLVLLLIYYVSIFIQANNQLYEGWGYAMSYAPLFSMLLMPMKILSHGISIEEVVLSLLVSISVLSCIILLGESYYRKNILYKKGQKV